MAAKFIDPRGPNELEERNTNETHTHLSPGARRPDDTSLTGAWAQEQIYINHNTYRTGAFRAPASRWPTACATISRC
jgi:hypothetical protein